MVFKYYPKPGGISSFYNLLLVFSSNSGFFPQKKTRLYQKPCCGIFYSSLLTFNGNTVAQKQKATHKIYRVRLGYNIRTRKSEENYTGFV